MPIRNRRHATVVLGVALAVLLTACYPKTTVAPLTGLANGSVVTITIDARPPDNPAGTVIFGAEARLCKPGVTIANNGDFSPTQGGNCIRDPLSPGTSVKTSVEVDPPYQLTSFTYTVGVGTNAFTTQFGDPVSITCGPGNPCQLVVKQQIQDGFKFVSFPVTYA